MNPTFRFSTFAGLLAATTMFLPPSADGAPRERRQASAPERAMKKRQRQLRKAGRAARRK